MIPTKTRRISHRTLFFMREYGPHAHIASNIIRESLYVLLPAAIISSLGGIGLEVVRTKFLTILPLVILLPALNDMVGDFGTVISSKFTIALYRGYIKEAWWRSQFVRELGRAMFTIALIAALYIGALSSWVAYLQGSAVGTELLFHVLEVALIAAIVLTSLIFAVSIFGGLAIYRRREDPNNFLIPLTIAIADFGSLVVLSALVVLLF
jgi:cation transporter-like permease